MSVSSRWILACGIILAIPLSGRAQPVVHPQVNPAWPDTSSPAREFLYQDADGPAVPITSVNLYLPDPKWANLPIRVFLDDGTAVGCDLLWTAPGEPATLLFDSSSGAKRYNAYLCSNWPEVHLPDTKAGVWLECREGDGKAINSLPDMLQAWNKSGKVLGRALLRGIYEGGNRFGPQGNLFDHLRGWFQVAAPEHLQLAVISDDAAFVLVDGKEVVEWPGLHNFQEGRGGQHNGAVDLSAGLHFLDCYNAYVASDGQKHPVLCSVAAKSDDSKPWTMLTEESGFFLPVASAHIITYELKANSSGASLAGGIPPVAFKWTNRKQCMIDPDQSDLGLITIEFENLYMTSDTCNWTFDDGTSAQGPSAKHVFPRAGMRTVRLTLTEGGKQVATVAQTVSVHYDWWHVAYAPPELLPEMEADIMSRDPTTMPASDLASCFAVFEYYEKADELAKFLPAVYAKMKEINEADLPYIKEGALLLAREDWADYAGECQLLQALIDRASSPTVSPQLLAVASESRLNLARLTIKTSDHLDEARTLLDAVNVPSLTGDEARELMILRADLALAGGDVAGARKQYETLTSTPSGPDARSSIRRTAKIGQARAFIDRKDFAAAEDALNDVAWNSPIDKLSPDWALARLRLDQEENLPVAAYLWAKRLLPALMESGRSELLFRLTDLAFAQNDNDLAHKTLSELLKKHPYSDEAAQAKEKWPGQE